MRSRSNNNIKLLPRKGSQTTKAKARPLLSPPEPTATNVIDTQPRLHVNLSASGYGVAIATKGGPTGEKAYMRPAEQTISDPNEVKLLRMLKCYGMVRLRDPHTWGCNQAQQIKWTTKRGEVRKCNKHVSNKNAK